MGRHYIYRMDIVENDTYHGSYIGQHKIGKKDPSCDGYKGSGCRWKREILSKHIPVKKAILKICEDIKETNYWEQYYIEEALQDGVYLWNVVKGGGGHEHGKVYTEEELRMHNKERFDRWYQANKEYHAEYGRRYRKANKERVRAAKKRYEAERKEFYDEYYKQYYEKNKERLSEQRKQYYQQNKERFAEQRKEYGKQYRATHAEMLAEKSRRHYRENKEKHRQYYSRPCCYNGEMLTFGALRSRLRRKHVVNPTKVAELYLIKGEE